jgi:WLM domain
VVPYAFPACFTESQVRRQWSVKLLKEFYPADKSLLGLNVNRGQCISVRLRNIHDERSFLQWEDILGTFVHELTHIQEGSHSAAFYRLMDQLIDEVEKDMIQSQNLGVAPGFIPFSGTGHRLGGSTGYRLGGGIRDAARACGNAANEIHNIARKRRLNEDGVLVVDGDDENRVPRRPMAHNIENRRFLIAEAAQRRINNVNVEDGGSGPLHLKQEGDDKKLAELGKRRNANASSSSSSTKGGNRSQNEDGDDDGVQIISCGMCSGQPSAKKKKTPSLGKSRVIDLVDEDVNARKSRKKKAGEIDIDLTTP